MVQFKRICWYLVFILCYLEINVHALKCFVCSTAIDPGCATLSANDTSSKYFVECGDNKILCRKTIQSIADRKIEMRINRSCGWEIHKKNQSNCYENDDDFKFDKSCQCFTDGCNSATSNYSKLTTLFTICLVIKIFI